MSGYEFATVGTRRPGRSQRPSETSKYAGEKSAKAYDAGPGAVLGTAAGGDEDVERAWIHPARMLGADSNLQGRAS